MRVELYKIPKKEREVRDAKMIEIQDKQQTIDDILTLI